MTTSMVANGSSKNHVADSIRRYHVHYSSVNVKKRFIDKAGNIRPYHVHFHPQTAIEADNIRPQDKQFFP